MPLSSSFSSYPNIPISITGTAPLPTLSAAASSVVFQTFPDGSRTPAGPPHPMFSEARGAFDIFTEIQHRPRPRTSLLPVHISPVNPAAGLSSAAQAGLTMPPLRAPRPAFMRPPAPVNFPPAVRAPSAFRAAASSLMSSVSSLVGPWLPGARQQTLPHVETILAPIPSAIAHAAAQQPMSLAASQAAVLLHSAPSTPQLSATSADNPIDLDSHNDYSEMLLATSTPSDANGGQADVDRMMAMTAGPAVPAAELAALLAPATLARGSAVPVATGLMPVSSTATTSTSPSPPPPPPSP